MGLRGRVMKITAYDYKTGKGWVGIASRMAIAQAAAFFFRPQIGPDAADCCNRDYRSSSIFKTWSTWVF